MFIIGFYKERILNKKTLLPIKVYIIYLIIINELGF